MNEWIKDFNVIYKGELYKNCVSFREEIYIHLKETKIEKIMILYIDENGMLNVIHDDVKEFKFVRK